LQEKFPTESFEDRYADEARVNIDLSYALKLLRRASNAHLNGDINKAIELYKESIAFCPTADAHTYLGWMYTFQDRLEEAIEECHQAIEIDPDFGNPYNDIGAYLMELKEFDEAVIWLEKAKSASRYESRHLPYINLARRHIAQGEYGKAIGELYGAIQREPRDVSIQNKFKELLSLLN
jgi:tetratricopeptide (TPR) repeat protein